jgi:hypothetical protein
MGNRYEWGNNPIRDFFFQLLLLGHDITSKEFEKGIEDNIQYIIYQLGVRKEDLPYLEFNIRKSKERYFKVVPDNIVTAMWFAGFFPDDPDLFYTNNSGTFGGKRFKFNKRTKKLTWKKK